ncbi:MAG: polysaccharide biosynthesis/export family protein [Rikenellaceae bacterium]
MKRLLYISVLITLLQSCAAQQNIAYLQDKIVDTEISIVKGGDLKLKPNDQISIFVSSKSPELASIFNLARVQSSIGGSSSSNETNSQNGSLSYTVDKDGNIDFPVLGEIYVEGLTKSDVVKEIKRRILESEMLKDPIVTVDFANLTFSTIGEVASPGVYNITKDQTTIIDALSMSGDMTIYGLRDRVFVTRKTGDKLITYRLDLTSKDIYQSPAYYVQQNDVIYVEPNKVRSNQASTNGGTVRTVSFWMSLASFLTTLTLIFVN